MIPKIINKIMTQSNAGPHLGPIANSPPPTFLSAALLLFLNPSDDLPDCINNSTIRLFADDCIVYRHISNSDDTTRY